MKTSQVLVGIASVAVIVACSGRIYRHSIELLRAGDPAKEARAALTKDLPEPIAPDFRPIQVVSPFPAITNAPVVSSTAIGDRVTDSELILGIELNGESRAYPINMLTGPQREIINDRLGGRALAATW